MSGEANNCTIELVHGGSIHVAHTPEEVKTWMQLAIMAPGLSLIRLERVTSFAARATRGFHDVDVNPAHITAIYPLTSRSDPPRERSE